MSIRLYTAVALAVLEGRSPKWPGLRDAHLLKEPVCVACGGRTHLNVHHRVPVHVDPTKELDPSNLITLCEHPAHNCHLIWGHLLNWKSWNPEVREQATEYRQRVTFRPPVVPHPVHLWRTPITGEPKEVMGVCVKCGDRADGPSAPCPSA